MVRSESSGQSGVPVAWVGYGETRQSIIEKGV